MRILQEIRTIGIVSSGNKTVDTQKYSFREHKKNEETVSNQQELGVQVINQVDESEYAQQSELEEQRLGAMTIAELNKKFFGL